MCHRARARGGQGPTPSQSHLIADIGGLPGVLWNCGEGTLAGGLTGALRCWAGCWRENRDV